MRREDVEHLRCPDCGGRLTAEAFERAGDRIGAGILRCENGPRFPIIDGIPRFTEDALGEHPDFTDQYRDRFPESPDGLGRLWQRTSASFGLQWLTYEVMNDDEDRATFFAKTGFAEDNLAGARVLDAGCGSGRYARIAAAAGARVTAVDLSRACERAKRALAGYDDALVAQANLMSLPFAPASFDAVYSIGVLHHTPDTRKALGAIARFVKPGGRLAVWLYKKRDPVFEAANRLLRGVTTRMSHPALMRLSQLAVPIGALKRAALARRSTAWLSKLLPPCSSHPDPHIRVCDTFDWYSPEFQWHHTDEEVAQWLADLGFTHLRNLSREYQAFHALQGDGVNFLAEKA